MRFQTRLVRLLLIERNLSNFILYAAKNVGIPKGTARLFNKVKNKIWLLQPIKRSPNKSITLTSFIFIFSLLFFSCGEQKKVVDEKKEIPAEPVDYLSESPEDFDQRMEWWRDATFGMFIHWGLYAIPAGEHNGKRTKDIGEWIMHHLQIPVSEYEQYAAQFNPVDFDADEWAKIAADAGMKYMVITSKHHDGFCLWDSKVSKYDVVDATPYGKDLLAPLKKACDKHGIKLGFYYSIMDWHHPDAQAPNYPNYNSRDTSRINPNFPNYIENYVKPQLVELIENYDPALLWFDGEWVPDYTTEMGKDIYQFLREIKPELIINNRVDKGRQGMQGMNSEGDFAGDFGTPEQEILENTVTTDWESCMTINDTWGFKSFDDNWKSTETLIHNLIDVTAKGGNYLLNVGPTAKGKIPPESVQRLNEIGKWIQGKEEAIYATQKNTTFRESDNILYSRSKDDKTVYAFILNPDAEKINLNSISPATGTSIDILGTELQAVISENDPKEINLPESLVQDQAVVLKVSIE